MSLILEALKKSERERRLGETPSIGSPVVVVRRQRSRLPLLIGLIAAALVIGWWLRREPAATATPETTAASTAETPAASPAANPSPPIRATAPPERAPGNADARLPRSKAAADATAAMAPDLRAKVKNGEIVVANPNLLIPGRSSTIASPETMPPPAAAIAPVDAPRTADRPVMSMPEPQKLADPAPAAGSKQVAPSVAAAPTTDRAGPAEAPPVVKAPGSLMLLWELPYAKRREIPELKVTMHVFASEPAQRFIVVNGDRHVEGDDLEGLKVIEIRADGVVMEFDGQRFLYPRGGR